MDAITLLRNDHETVEQLFKRFEKAGDRAHVEKRQIVDRIIEELSVHAAIEEQVFYPVARATVPDTEDIALESLEEHHIVKWVLSELADLDPRDERFDAKVTVLIENVRHHVEEEEDEFFPKVRRELSRKALADLGDALAEAKKSAPTHPHPRCPTPRPPTPSSGAIAGVVDRVGDNISGIAQGGVSVSRTSSPDPEQRQAEGLTDRLDGCAEPGEECPPRLLRRRPTAPQQTARSVRSGAATTARAASSGAKATATTAQEVGTGHQGDCQACGDNDEADGEGSGEAVDRHGEAGCIEDGRRGERLALSRQ